MGIRIIKGGGLRRASGRAGEKEKGREASQLTRSDVWDAH